MDLPHTANPFDRDTSQKPTAQRTARQKVIDAEMWPQRQAYQFREAARVSLCNVCVIASSCCVVVMRHSVVSLCDVCVITSSCCAGVMRHGVVGTGEPVLCRRWQAWLQAWLQDPRCYPMHTVLACLLHPVFCGKVYCRGSNYRMFSVQCECSCCVEHAFHALTYRTSAPPNIKTNRRTCTHACTHTHLTPHTPRPTPYTSHTVTLLRTRWTNPLLQCEGPSVLQQQDRRRLH